MFTKDFFAHDKRNYDSCVPCSDVILESIRSRNLSSVHPRKLGSEQEINAEAPFCAVGADNALEHKHRSMKVSGGLVGITLNEAPELTSLAEQAKNMAGVSSKLQGRYHNLTTAVLAREQKGVAQLTATIERFTNPFPDAHTDLFNLMTKVFMPETVKKDLCKQSKIGMRLF